MVVVLNVLLDKLLIIIIEVVMVINSMIGFGKGLIISFIMVVR